ncbi:hypothetical protein IMZ48_21745, partial [Candidatus Bathyarchaeota archaeon]|nr:hypothetical protein [Candidatus Bathyarchaeota archaeon]
MRQTFSSSADSAAPVLFPQQPQVAHPPATMAQPQHPHLPTPAAPAFSPPTQQSPSPTPSSAAFALPPNKRPKLSPAPHSQPQSPYNYAQSPGATGVSPAHTPTSAAASPQFAGVPLPPTTVTTPNAIAAPTMPALHTNLNSQGYTNGNTPASHPDAHASQFSPSPYTAATMAPIAPQPSGAPAESPATPGSMAPPTRPPDRPTKEYDYEPTDMLAGTGIDLRAEEQLATELLLSGHEASYGFPQYPPGSKDSFHGAGPMNQASEHAKAQSQAELEAMAARKAWDAASKRLATSRAHELNAPYTSTAVVHRKLDKFAKEQGLDLHLDYKNPQNTQTKHRTAEDQPPPRVEVSTKTLPDSTVVTTSGSFVAQDTHLADQLALLSLACKQRMRALVEDAYRFSTNRQESSHGEIPDEWADIAAPLPGMAAVE